MQFPAIARQLKIDLAAIKMCVALIGRLFPKFEYTWVLPEFQGCAPSLCASLLASSSSSPSFSSSQKNKKKQKDYMKMESNFEQEVQNNAKIKRVCEKEKTAKKRVIVNDICYLDIFRQQTICNTRCLPNVVYKESHCDGGNLYKTKQNEK